MLTLTGPGGTGKTRLALQAAAEVAEDVPDGVWWVSLAALRDPALALDAVAKALDVRERPVSRVEETLVDALAAKRALLLIDNAEHLLPQVASRHRPPPRGRRAEAAGDEQGAAAAAGRARVDGAVAGRPRRHGPVHGAGARAATGVHGDARDRELCARLDNLPLALELAAARIPIFSPEQLLERLGKGVDLKGGRDADPRQQTLRRDDPLVIRPPRAGRAAAVRAACRVRGRMHV